MGQARKVQVNLEEFDKLFEIESKKLGHPVKGKDVIALLRGQVRPEMIAALKKLKVTCFRHVLQIIFNQWVI